MKPVRLGVLLVWTALLSMSCAETERIDLKALSKKARPAVLLLVVSDANGKEIATGTGFLVSSDGKLITNHHVIEYAASAVAKAENGGLFPVEGVLADDAKNDLVLLKLKGKDLPFLSLGNSDKVEVGARIAVIGSPLGLEGTLSEGIISAVRKLLGDQRIFQLTAAVSPGSSGSPVLNGKGEVIGVATSLIKGGQSLNFAVSGEAVKELLGQPGASVKTKPLSEFAKEAGQGPEADPDHKAFETAHLVGDYVEALKLAKTLLTRFPNSANAYVDLGGSYYMLEFYTDAIEAFRQAIKLKPDYAPAWCCLGGAYLALDKNVECIGACQQALKLEPDDKSTWDILGTAYLDVKQYAEAVAAFQQAIKIKPDYAQAWYDLGLAYGRIGEYEKAWGSVRQLEKFDPKKAGELSELLRRPSL